MIKVTNNIGPSSHWISAIVLVLLLLILSQPGFAKAPENPPVDTVEIGSWHLGVAVGLGAKSNPLQGGDDIPLLVLPDIHYYGEHWFMDNFTLGYSFYQREHLVMSLITAPNAEKAYFGFWHPTNLVSFTEIAAGDSQLGLESGDTSRRVGIDDIPHRHFAWDGGLQANLFTQMGNIEFQLLTDVSGVYRGEHAKLQWTNVIRQGDWQWRPTLGVSWQSRSLVDYYYGLQAKTNNAGRTYRGRSGWSPFVALSVSKPINDRWLGQFNIKFQDLDSGMTDSPLVRKDHTLSVFVGAAYQF